MSLNSRKFLTWKERGRVREREGWADQQAGIFKVRLGLVEIETEIKRQRDRANNKKHEQSREAQLVINKLWNSWF
jgi:hypothetical protein